MKYLQDYMEEAQTKAFDKAGAFFAYSNKQYEEQKQPGIRYVSMGLGLICPKETSATLMDELAAIAKQGIKDDLAENGKEGVIKRELANHECFYTGDPSGAIEALEGYGISDEDIIAVFNAGRRSR